MADAPESKSIQLDIEHTGGKNSRDIVSQIFENGDLHIAGVDDGPITAEFFGSSEYEYFLTIKAKDKDLLLLHLLKALHGHTGEIVSDVMQIARAADIRYEFATF